MQDPCAKAVAIILGARDNHSDALVLAMDRSDLAMAIAEELAYDHGHPTPLTATAGMAVAGSDGGGARDDAPPPPPVQ